MVKAVILAGGSGSRLWPRSRPDLPKQFVPFLGGRSMLQQTIDRLAVFLPYEDVYVVTADRYVSYVKEQTDLPAENIIVEPEPKDTAACIGLAAIHFLHQGLDPVLITLPSDHYIDGGTAFRDAILAACRQAERQPCVVMVGIKPNRPETAYGYVKVKAGIAGNVLPVEKFTEKPDRPTARKWIGHPEYYWNSGIFVWRASVIMALMGQHMPKLTDSLRQIQGSLGTPEERDVLRKAYRRLNRISIDYGVLEKASCLYLVPASFAWDDLGNWTALERVMEKDPDGNVVVGRHHLLNTHNCIVYSEKVPVGAIGVEDLIITVTDQAVLVCRKGSEHEIKKLLREKP